MTLRVRRVRADEWDRVRDLRLDAVRDPAAPIAFLHSHEEEAARPSEFWQQRTERAASGDSVAQFIAESDGEWIGTLSVLRRLAGSPDHHGRPVDSTRGDIVGVFVRPQARGQGAIEALVEAAAQWASALGDAHLTLEVHADNERAQAAYRRLGFAETGLRFTGTIGPEFEMARALDGPATRRILLVNGPNLNLLGTRDPAVYGTSTLADVERITADAAADAGLEVRSIQSNHEGVLIDAIHAAREDCVGIVINPGGLTHTSVALRDALTGVLLPFAEVHISDVNAREDFRRFSYLHDVASVRVIGEGVNGYATAVAQLAALIP